MGTPSSLVPSSSSSSTSTPVASLPITPADKEICTHMHVMYCFDVLVAHFERREPLSPPFDNASESFALFVTWNTFSRQRPNRKPALRGCIGNFTPMPLGKGLRDYALVSALEDHRFPPMKESELPTLQCCVSLLTPFTPISDPLGWIVGTHGIHITFPNPSSPRRTLSATYLPEVASEQGWTKEETILSAIQKAGWRSTVKVGDEVWKSLKVKIYASEKAKGSWEEYVSWKSKLKDEQ